MNAGSDAPSDNEFIASSQNENDNPPVDNNNNEYEPSSSSYVEMKETNDESTNNIINEEEQIEETIEEMKTELKTVQEEAIEGEQTQLEEAASGVLNSIRVGIGRLFGTQLSNDEVEDVAEQVQEQLMSDATTMLRGKAETIVNREIDGINTMVQKDEAKGFDAQEIADDVQDQEVQVVDHMRSAIDGATDEVKETMRKHAAEIEKEILEDRLTKRFGKKVKLVIVDDQVQLDSEVDNMLNGLNNLVPNGQYGSSYQQPPPAGYGQPAMYGQPPAYGQQQVPPQYPPQYQPMPGGGYGQRVEATPGHPFRLQDPPTTTTTTTTTETNPYNNVAPSEEANQDNEEPAEQAEEGTEGLVEDTEEDDKNDPW